MSGGSAGHHSGRGLASRLWEVVRWGEELMSELHHRRWSGGDAHLMLAYLCLAQSHLRSALAALKDSPPLSKQVRVTVGIGAPVLVAVFGTSLVLMPGRGPFKVALAVGVAAIASEVAVLILRAIDRRRVPSADATLLPATPEAVDPVDTALQRMHDCLDAAISAQPEPIGDSPRMALASARLARDCLKAAIEDRR